MSTGFKMSIKRVFLLISFPVRNKTDARQAILIRLSRKGCNKVTVPVKWRSITPSYLPLKR